MRSRVLEGLRVVLVDDDPDARELLAAVLLHRGANVVTATCASEAFELLKASPPHVLVSDIAMPEEDGYTLVRKLRLLDGQAAADDARRVVAIAVTAFAGRADRERALDAGFDDHLPKPVDIDRVVQRLAEVRGSLAPTVVDERG
ncbi:MAG: Two-component hybrid sensor and regulator [Labilithrix sp.]|nr:Two-component hybrid sensor and regulator [Labilithrix sp.]